MTERVLKLAESDGDYGMLLGGTVRFHTSMQHSFTVTAYRSAVDGKLVVDIDTTDLGEVDEAPDVGEGAVPLLRVNVNDTEVNA